MQTLQMVRGDTKKWDGTATLANLPDDLTGVDLTMTARLYPGAAEVVFSKTIGDGLTILDAQTGLLRVQLAEADTSALPSRLTRLYFDIQWSKDGEKHTAGEGYILVRPDITI